MFFSTLKPLSAFVLEAKKITDAAISREKIETLLDKSGLPMRFPNIREKHGEVSVLATPNDNFMLKVTCLVVWENANGKRGSGSLTFQNPLYRLHASSAGLYSREPINKSKPTGTTRLNPFINVDDDGKSHNKSGSQNAYRRNAEGDGMKGWH